MTVELVHGDCIVEMANLADCSIDAIVTDPPYGLEFMGKEWDSPWKVKGTIETAKEGTDDSHPFRDGSQRVRYGIGPGFQLWCEQWAAEALRVLKPGGHLLAFGGTRTWHRLACAIEDAGFEIRDSIAWLYGSGFPKSLDVSKAIDKAAGAEREVVGSMDVGPNIKGDNYGRSEGRMIAELTAPATLEAEKWQGWGTALKPAFEPIVVARKPLIGTVAANVLEHGTGALNIDATRVAYEDDEVNFDRIQRQQHSEGSIDGAFGASALIGKEILTYKPTGRWPANATLDEDTAAVLDEQSQASRFFYVAKAPKSERPVVDGIAHPTVKPVTLMRWLVRLVTPPGGTLLDPFAGSGTTVEAAILEGFNCIAIEREADYLPLIEQRIDNVEINLFGGHCE